MTKRVLDFLCAGAALIALSPLLGLLTLLVWSALGRPVFFRQLRPGLGGRPFVIIKFRTMREVRGVDGRDLPDERRMTRFGSFLRRWSLDELPELVNVVRGEMSLIGPRPLLMEYLPLYTAHQARRHEVRPGLTGLAQVKGRNALSWERKFELDVWYVDHRSLAMDARIILQTVGQVLGGAAVSHVGHATMPPFRGQRGPDREDCDV